MKISTMLSTFHPESFAPKAVRRRELTRTWLAATLAAVVLTTVSAVVLIESFGGWSAYGR